MKDRLMQNLYFLCLAKRLTSTATVIAVFMFEPVSAFAAQCLVNTIETRDGSYLSVQILEPKDGPKKLISDKGFERVNCKKLSAKEQAYADEMCMAAQTLPPEVASVVQADLGFAPKTLCDLSKSAAKEAEKAKKAGVEE